MLQRPGRRDEGMTLIEVMVALLVFGIIATGIVAAAGTITRMTGDNRARSTAANLAAQDLDLVRAVADPFQVVAATTDIPVDGRTYTVKRSISWISTSGADVSCASSTNLFYLRVNVRVTWPAMLGATAAVQDDTILAPAGRIGDTSTGSIGVSITGVDAKPTSGVSVTITPTSGGKALTTQPAATGADGCTYANKVSPGTYSVAISKSGWIDNNQVTAPSKTVTVYAGATASVSFQYDQAATFTTTYKPGPVTYSGAVYVPTNVETNFTSTSGTYTTAAPAASVKLHPFSSGYAVFAGKASSGSTTCASVDPRQWSASGTLGTGTVPSAAAAPGGSASVAVPVGIVLIKPPANYSIGITQATPTGAGNPGCNVTGSIYTLAVKSTGSWMAVALPYGSWKVYYGTGTNSATALGSSLVQTATNTLGGGVASDGTVTLDPRPAR